MMKRQPSGSGLRLSRLCRWLVFVAAIKLSLLLGLALDLPEMLRPFFEDARTSVATITSPHAPADALPQQVLPADAPAARGKASAPGMGVAMAAETTPPPATQTDPPAPAGDLMNRETLQRKQEELSRREQELRQLQHQVDTRLEELQSLESKLQTMIKEAQGMKDDKFRHLVDVYTNMKAKQAAAVLETLDERIAVKILAGMRGRQAGEILTFVDAKKAARLSEALTRMQLPLE